MPRGSGTESGVFTSRDFRDTLGQFATGVTVITTRGEDHAYGMTASAFSSVSLDPPLVLVCIGLNAAGSEMIRRNGVFAVNILGTDHEGVSRRFATTRLDKFDGVPFTVGALGVPLIEGALAQLECRTVSRHVEGDHTILVGRVEEARNGAGEPLLYYRGKYGRLAAPPPGTTP
jgi:flavin reductase (DIM6/NTAB) family NADH-FMN oxidoreductase RutF